MNQIHRIFVGLVLIAAPSFAATNLVQNGSFELPGIVGVVTYGPGSTTLPGWIVGGNGFVFQTDESYGIIPSDGAQHVGFHWEGHREGATTISQMIPTVSGGQYQVEFSVAAQYDFVANPNGSVSLRAEAHDGGGSLLESLSVAPTVTTSHQSKTLSFQAVSSTSLILFIDTSVDQAGADIFLDDIRIPGEPLDANAGPDQTSTNCGQSFQLDGSGSTPSTGAQFAWSIVDKPGDSTATLANADTATPSFIPDVSGIYKIHLKVSLSGVTDEDDVEITVDCLKADAGPNQNVNDCTLPVHLDGSGSLPSDPALTFDWSFLSVPAGSLAVLNDPSSPTPSFVPHPAGRYEIELSVSLGQQTDTDSVTIVAESDSPTARISFAAERDPFGNVLCRGSVLFTGIDSTDDDGEIVHYDWSVYTSDGASPFSTEFRRREFLLGDLVPGGFEPFWVFTRLRVTDDCGEEDTDISFIHCPEFFDAIAGRISEAIKPLARNRNEAAQLMPPPAGMTAIGLLIIGTFASPLVAAGASGALFTEQATGLLEDLVWALIERDPPREDFDVIYTPTVPTLELPFDLDGLPDEVRDTVLSMAQQGAAVAEYLRAILVTLERHGGAVVAGDAGAAEMQNRAMEAFAWLLSSALRGHSRSLHSLAEFFSSSEELNAILTLGDVMSFLDEFERTGFPESELSLFDQLGASAEAVADMRNAVLNVDPSVIVGYRVSEILMIRSEFEDSIAIALANVAAVPFLRADSNSDGIVDLSDPIHTLAALFLGEGEFKCPDAADSNDDGDLDVSDGIHTLAYLFTGGPAPPAPGPHTCGPDPTEDNLPECVYDSELCGE